LDAAESVFIPLGGVNQDDSIVTPVQTSSGDRSPFEIGDYRYALNTRIGSSRHDNFGDVENIKGTQKVTTYIPSVERETWTNDNPTFTGSIAGWLQAGGSPEKTWAYGSGGGYFGAKVTLSSDDSTERLYQSESITAGDYLAIEYTFGRDVVVSDPSLIVGLYLVFMSGVTELSSLYIDNLNSYGPGISNPGNSMNMLSPVTCDGIGFKVVVSGSGSLSNIKYSFNKFKITHIFSTPGPPPSGRSKNIGKYEDLEFQQIYNCNWNENGQHTITRWDVATNTIIEILRWEGLNFQENSFVKMAKLDNWISFTDKINPPRLIDTNTISDLFLILGAENFREFHISHHKWAPIMPPVTRILYDGSHNNYEKLKNKAYQFSYRYIYKGKLISRFSPISKANVTASCGFFYSPGPGFTDKRITSIEVDIPGMLLDVPGASTQYNYFDHTDVKFINAVETIEVAYREGELELWKLWMRIPVTPAIQRLYYFTGDADNTPIPQEDFNQLFDTVPFLAGTVEAVDNRFVYADCLNEQQTMDNLDITNMSVVHSDLTGWASSYPGGFPAVSPVVQDELSRLNSLSQFSFKQRGKYKLAIQFFHPTGWRSAGYTIDTWGYDSADVPKNDLVAFNFKIPSGVVPPEWAVAYQIMRTNVLNIDFFMTGIVNQLIPVIDSVDTILDRISIPDNTKQVIREHFANSKIVSGYDAASFTESSIQQEIDARERAAQNDGWNKLLKLNENIGKFSGFPELALSNKFLNKNLRHNPIIGDLANQILKVQQTNIINDCSRIMIDINNWYNAAKKTATADQPTVNKLFYNYRVGDRVRFTGSDVANPSNVNQTKIYDVPIISFTGKAILIERPAGLMWIPGPTSFSADDFIIEVYTPKTANESDFFYYETGEVYPVLYPGKSNRDFAKRDWTYTNNGAVTSSTYGPFNFFNKLPFFYADCLAVSRTVYRDYLSSMSPAFLSGATGISMNPDPGMNYDYWDRYNGRPTITYRDLPPVKFIATQARFSGKIVEQSLVNQLNRFNDADQYNYPSEYGRIRNIINTANAQVESIGSIILMIGEREAWSVYVNRTTLEDLSGNTQVSLSNQVLGSYNTLLGSHGTLNPESVSQYRGKVYWWDAINGAWIRYGRDGITAISDYKMRNWFKELSDLLITKYLTDELPTAISSYDPFNDELVTFINHSSLPATFRGYDSYKGFLFSERDTRWKSAHSYAPERFAKINNQLVSFKEADIYLHEIDEDHYNTFYGVKYDSKIEPVFNKDLFSVKHWQNMIVVSTNKWFVERVISEYRGKKALISSRVKIDQVEEREDSYFLAFKRDLNTPNVSNPIVNGQAVRCKAIQVLLTLDPDVDYLSLMHMATSTYIDSPKNP